MTVYIENLTSTEQATQLFVCRYDLTVRWQQQKDEVIESDINAASVLAFVRIYLPHSSCSPKQLKCFQTFKSKKI